MSSLVLDIDDWPVAPGAPATINRLATYFLLMTGSDVDVTLYYKGSRIGSGKGLQGGDGIGPLSVPYDKIVLESATSQVCKVAVTSDPVTITRLSGVVKVDGVVQTAPDFSRVKAGLTYLAQKNVFAVAGEFGYMQLWNEEGSGKNLVVTAINISSPSTSEAVLAASQVEATSAVLSNFIEVPSYSMRLATPAQVSSESNVKIGTSADSEALYGAVVGGRAYVSNGWTQFYQPFVIEPGAGLIIRSRDVNQDVAANMQYFEDLL